MTISDGQIALLLQQYMLPFSRIAMLFMVIPVFGSRVLPMRVRLVLALLLTAIVVPLIDTRYLFLDGILSLHSLLLIARECLLGASIGFVLQIVFQVFVLSGQIMAMKIGLGFAMMNDPTNGVQTTVISQFFLILATVMFVAVNGHLYIISLLVDSFTLLPIGSDWITADSLLKLVKLASWMFSAALVFSLPVVTSLLFINIAFGVMSRAAPQLNIFAVGFPFTLMMGLVIIWIGLSNYFEAFTNSMNVGFEFIHTLIGV